AKPKALITEYPLWRSLAQAGRAAFQGLVVMVSEAPAMADLASAGRWEDKVATDFRYVERGRRDTACIVYSSGTGGTPKGCMLTHDSYLTQAQALGRMYPMQESDRYLSILPTNHAIDFMCGMIVPFLFGAAVVHQRTLRPEFVTLTLKRCRITHMALVPRILTALQERIRLKLDGLPAWQRSLLEGLLELNDLATARGPRPELSRFLLKPIHDEFGGALRLIFCGGAFVAPKSAEFFYRLGIPVVIGYGLTEACAVVTLNDLSPFRANTVGKPVDGVEVALRNQDERGVGEVCVRGPALMSGYLDAPDLTERTLIRGWLKTGDLGSFDAAGHLRLLGRAKDMIVTQGGKNVYPEDVEASFDGLPGCLEHCVYAAQYLWPSGNLSDDRLLIILRPEGTRLTPSTVEELRRRNRGLLEHKRVAGYVPWVAEFPRTASLKIKRHELARVLREQLDSDAVATLEKRLRNAS
ncbi:MAG: AMP-binding protein, partial [Proteobacteria bacterium]|nr:AMP-binding protein [Pseudomonadota bacterium]